MDNNDYNQSINIRIDPEKVLFAEGLVNYILQTNSLPGILHIFEEQEESDVRIRDMNMRMAVALNNNKDRTYTEEVFGFLMDNNLINVQNFICAVEAKKKQFGYQPYYEAFLQYAIHLAQLAGKLCAQGLTVATRKALMYIVNEMTFDIAGFECEITGMIARECRGQLTYNTVLYRQQEELGYGQHTNPYNWSSSDDIGVPGSSRTEPTNLTFHSSDSV